MGFTDLVIVRDGKIWAWRVIRDVKMPQKSREKVVTNYITTVLFRSYNKIPT